MPADTHDATIRRLEPHDQAAYRALRLESLRTNPALFGTTYAEAAAMPSLPFETFIRERAPDHAMFGAFVDGTLVGLCGFRRETRERARHSGELVEMYVAPHVAGRGIGARLVDAVLRFAFEELGASQVVLGVAAGGAACASSSGTEWPCARRGGNVAGPCTHRKHHRRPAPR